MLWPTAIFWTAALILSRGPFVGLVYALFAAMPFGAFAVVPPELVGGLVLTPAPIIAALLVCKCLGTADGRRWLACACRSVEHFVPLFGFWIVAVLTTPLAPALFGTHIEVPAPRVDAFGPDGTASLSPALQQLGQIGHVTVSVLVVVAAARLLRYEDVRRHVPRAMVLGGALTVLTGLVDRVFTGVGTADPLGPLRTANHAIAGHAWAGSLADRPLTGLMPDHVAFGTLCAMFVAALWFHRHVERVAWLRAVLVPGLCVPLGFMVWRSMSPLAWTGLAIVIAAGVVDAAWHAVRPHVRLGRRGSARTRSGARRFALLTLAGLALFAGSGIAYERGVAHMERLVPAESVTASGPERGTREAVSLRGVIDTWGMGGGLDGTRASNPFLALLGGVGVLGALCYVAFVTATWAWWPQRHRTDELVWMAAYRWSVPCLVVVALAGGSTVDFGPCLALLFGGSVALRRGARTERLLQSCADGEADLDRELAQEGRHAQTPDPSGAPTPRPVGTRSPPRGVGWDGAAFAVDSPGMIDLGEPDPPRTVSDARPASPRESACPQARRRLRCGSGAMESEPG